MALCLSHLLRALLRALESMWASEMLGAPIIAFIQSATCQLGCCCFLGMHNVRCYWRHSTVSRATISLLNPSLPRGARANYVPPCGASCHSQNWHLYKWFQAMGNIVSEKTTTSCKEVIKKWIKEHCWWLMDTLCLYFRASCWQSAGLYCVYYSTINIVVFDLLLMCFVIGGTRFSVFNQ